MSAELETMSNPLGDQALSVSDAAAAFRNLDSGKPETAQAEEEKPEAQAEVEGADAPDTEATPEADAKGEGDDQPEPQVTEQAKRYRVKVDGVESQVSFEELRNGYQRNVDYQAKMAKVSDAQRQVDAQRQAYTQRIDTVVPQMEQLFQNEFSDIKSMVDVQNLATADPVRYLKWDAAQKALHVAQSERQRLQDEQTRTQQQKAQEYLAEQNKQLVAELPEFGDAEKGPKLKSEIRSYLKTQGFADEELSQITNARALLISRKAMLYDRAQKQRVEASKTLQNVPKVQKPGSTTKADPKGEATRATFERLGKTGRVDDAANVFRAMKIFG